MNYIQTNKSSFGRGSMLIKTNIARKMADEGITIIIANGKRDDILINLTEHPEEIICTRFIPTPRPVSSIKGWITHSEGFTKGEMHISERASEVLNSDKAVSILPIGITRIGGGFEKDDIVRIIDNRNVLIDVGKTNYDSTRARDAIERHEKKAVVRYGYLYVG